MILKEMTGRPRSFDIKQTLIVSTKRKCKETSMENINSDAKVLTESRAGSQKCFCDEKKLMY